MKAFTIAAALAGAALATPTTVSPPVSKRQDSVLTAPLPIVTVKGNAFFRSDNSERFFVRGVAYQPGGEADVADPLADMEALKRDLEHFKELNVNALRIYSVDNTVDHTEAMQMLNDAGIYLALDVNSPDFSLNREDADSLALSYNDKYLKEIFATIDEFSRFPNLLLMISGNEVINQKNNTIAAPYIKAVIRDMKNYIANRGYRPIPVGYAAADVAENVDQQLHYMDCGPDHVRGDFFALNDYSWCDPSSFTQSGWDAKVKRYTGYGAPIVMAEFGCNEKPPREWGEVASLFSSDMSSVYSGGIAYEFTVNVNKFGLGSLDEDGVFQPNDDYRNLATAYEEVSGFSGDQGYSDSVTASECPGQDDEWEVPDLLIPAMPRAAEEYMRNGAGEGQGLDKSKPGYAPSQWGGGEDASFHGSAEMITMDGEKPEGSTADVVNGQSSGNGQQASGNGNTGAASGLALPSMAVVSVFAAFAILL